MKWGLASYVARMVAVASGFRAYFLSKRSADTSGPASIMFKSARTAGPKASPSKPRREIRKDSRTYLDRRIETHTILGRGVK